jgi:tRNA A-37 threonylcarbamoyl transferase component Bud32
MFEDYPVIENETLEARERDFFKKLKGLPDELAERWENEFYDLTDVSQGFFDRFDAFIESRSGALAGSTEIVPGLNEDIVAEIRNLEKEVKHTFGDPNYFLGNGAVAQVYEMPISPHVCVKYVYDNAKYSEGNHIRTEYEYLRQLENHKVAGIRSPKPLFVRIHPSEGHSYGMEKINGKSLSAILVRRSENSDLIEMMRSVDREAVKSSLIEYMKSLHQEYKITHGDLFMRNIMVDYDGNFYVIDFGKAATEQVGEDHEARRGRDIATLTSEIGKFFEELDKIDHE